MRQAVDYYKVLGLRPDATGDEVHSAYRALALRYHPDRNPTDEAKTFMILVNQAHESLGDMGRRRDYDQSSRLTGPPALESAVLDAAREIVGRAGWPLIEMGNGDVILSTKGHRIFLRWAGPFGFRELNAWVDASVRLFKRDAADRSIVLAQRFLVADQIPDALHHLERPATAIDLTESRMVGAELQDAEVRAAFRSFQLE